MASIYILSEIIYSEIYESDSPWVDSFLIVVIVVIIVVMFTIINGSIKVSLITRLTL